MARLSAIQTVFASVQWLFFIFANTIVVPISIGFAFELPAEAVAGTVRSSLIFTGIACILQGWIGHRYPLMEGHSGLMWGLILNLCLAASAMGMSYTEVGGGIATGMLLAGMIVLVFGSFGWLRVLQRIFTPMVMSVYLFLLTFQLMFIFFGGMLQLTPSGTLNVGVSLLSVGVVAVVCMLKIKGGQLLGNFSILIGIAVGWLLYSLLFPGEAATRFTSAGFGFPLFPLGEPNWNMSIILITCLGATINLSNTIASIQAASQLLKKPSTARQYKHSYLLSGLFAIGASVFGLVPYAPFASSIGFLESTRIFVRKPFFLGGALMIFLGAVPLLGGMLAAMPITVGNAVLFAAYLQLFGTSLRSLNGYVFNSVTILRLALPVLFGLCIMHMDVSVMSALPALIQPLASNGFVMGVIISVILEKIIRWDRRNPSPQPSPGSEG